MNRWILAISWLATLEALADSSWSLIGQTPADSSSIEVTVIDAQNGESLPFRAIVTTSEGKFADGSGRNVYEDGRFFEDGAFVAEVSPGKTKIQLSRGPEYLPLEFEVECLAKSKTSVSAQLRRWINLAERGWFCGDNHVHAKHDSHTPIRTDLSYAALQARAQGLNWITEAGSNIDYDQIEQLNTDDFMIRHSGEIRPGPYVGHLNPPGLKERFTEDFHVALIQRPLPAQAVYEEVRKRGGIVIHTHPLIPRHTLHWMGATEAWSDAVAGHTADLFDVDAGHTELLWFAMLNLGNRVGVSGHTDAALGRTRTPSPGDTRIYCRAERQDYEAFVESMSEGKTMATNGGTVFAFFEVDGQGPGADLPAGKSVTAKLNIESLKPLQSAGIYLNGERVAAFNVNGKPGPVTFEQSISIPPHRDSWLLARVQDQAGKWCLTSPVYLPAVKSEATKPADEPAAILFEISNATRFADLSRDFFAHLIVTVRQPEQLRVVELRRDGKVLQRFTPADGNQMPPDDKIPVTGIFGDYAPGSIWHPAPESAWHFQADIPVTQTGWYRIHAQTESGRELTSTEIRFDAENPLSQAISAARLIGPDTELTLWGYGADVEVEKLDGRLVKGSWWYPKDIFWRIRAQFGERDTTLGWPKEQPVERFR